MRALLLFLLVLHFSWSSGCRTAPRRVETPPQATLTFVGDVLLDHWPVQELHRAERKKRGWEGVFDYPFRKVKHVFEGAVFCNHEGPLSDRAIQKFKDKNEPFYFQVDRRYVESLRRAGFRVVSLANNHIRDCGAQGVLDSVKVVSLAGMLPVGAGVDARAARAPAVVEEGGLRIAYLAYNLIPPRSVWAGTRRPGAAHADAKGVSSDVKAARAKADVVVVHFHWGKEYRRDWIAAPPSSARVRMARAAIDAGASLVVGEHSHTVERIERYKKGLIAYGLGNFLFTGVTHEGHPESMILKVKVGREGILSHEVVPVLISPQKARYQPVPLKGKAKDRFLRRLGAL